MQLLFWSDSGSSWKNAFVSSELARLVTVSFSAFVLHNCTTILRSGVRPAAWRLACLGLFADSRSWREKI